MRRWRLECGGGGSYAAASKTKSTLKPKSKGLGCIAYTTVVDYRLYGSSTAKRVKAVAASMKRKLRRNGEHAAARRPHCYWNKWSKN